MLNEIKKPVKIDYPEFEIENSIDPDYKKDLDKITFDNVTTSNTSRTLRNIRKNLTAKIKSEFGITDKEELNKKVDLILKTQGLHESNFDFMSNFEDGLQKKLNDISIDDNANKGTERSYKAYITDLTKPVFKLIGHDTLYRVMKDLYGRKEAKRLSANMYDYSLGISDSTGIGCIYCWALDTTKLVTLGRDFGTLKSSPAQRVSSYMSALCETVHQISNHLMGACALATIFLDVTHLMVYKQRVTLDELKNNSKGVRKILENEFQQFVHSINFNSRTGGTECPFTNVSIFDKVKLRAMLSDENYAWYFPNKKIVSTDLDKADKISDEEFKDYIIEYITEVQKVFIEFFDRGDPLSNGANYKFPVVTLNISKDENNQILDKESLMYFCKRDISKYNIFCSLGTKICSCCRMINSKEMMDSFAAQVNSLGGGGTASMGSHRVVTINFQRIALEAQSMEDYYNILKQRIDDAAKILKAHKLLIFKLKDAGLQSFITNGYINPGRLFSTFGILGTYEAQKTLKQKFNIEENVDHG